jgi:hypothetical protein
MLSISGDYVQPLFLMDIGPENSPVIGNFLNRPVQLHPTAHEGMVPAANTGSASMDALHEWDAICTGDRRVHGHLGTVKRGTTHPSKARYIQMATNGQWCVFITLGIQPVFYGEIGGAWC